MLLQIAHSRLIDPRLQPIIAIDATVWSRIYRRQAIEGLTFREGSKWEEFRNYLMGEVRFASLQKARPEEAQELYEATELAAKRRYQAYVRKSQEDWSEQI